MNLFSRVYYSLRNNLSKTFILFLVVFILGNVICGSLAIIQSIQSTQNEFRKHYGSKVEITLSNDLQFSIYQSGNEYMKMLRDRLEGIVYDSTIEYSYIDLNYYIDGMETSTLYYEEEQINDIYMCGVTNPQIGLIKNYKVELIEGRSFNDEEMENGSNVVLISDRFEIEENGITRKVELDDEITLQRTIVLETGEKVQEDVNYKVVGIYKRYDNVMIEHDRYTVDNHIARLYVPYNTLTKEEKRLNELNQEYKTNNDNNILLGNIYLQLEKTRDDTTLKVLLEERIYKHSVLEDYINHTSTSEIYNKISAPIESMSGIANFLLISSSVLCVLILSVAVFILIRNRKHEIGILISLGESKFKVILQIILEIYLIGMLGLGLSMISGNELGKAYSNYIVSEQVEDSKHDLSIDESKLQDELLESYSFKMSHDYIISVISVGSIIIILSVMIPVGYIVQLKPRKILL